jgi:hypothetical protein
MISRRTNRSSQVFADLRIGATNLLGRYSDQRDDLLIGEGTKGHPWQASVGRS